MAEPPGQPGRWQVTPALSSQECDSPVFPGLGLPPSGQIYLMSHQMCLTQPRLFRRAGGLTVSRRHLQGQSLHGQTLPPG